LTLMDVDNFKLMNGDFSMPQLAKRITAMNKSEMTVP